MNSPGGGAAGIDPAHFRHVCAHLPTGVTVVAAHTPEGPAGLAANSVASLSLEPPLMLFCPAKSSETWPRIRDSGSFCINVMGADHEGVVRRFAAKDGDRFANLIHEQRVTGPALPEAVAWIECEIEAEHDGGDHTIVVARVTEMAAADDPEPLVFFRGRYGGFRAPGPG